MLIPLFGLRGRVAQCGDRISNRSLLRIPLFLTALLALGLAGCSSTKPQSAPPNLVWPDPPDEPRVKYITSVSQPSDLGFKRSGFSRFANWLIGAEKAKEKFNKPFGLALDEGGNLCVTDTGANTVHLFDTTHKTWLHWQGVGTIRFVSPVAVAKTGDNLFVADSALGAVIGFNTKGALLFFRKEGLQRPAGLTVADGRLFVVDSQLNAILVFDLAGALLTQFGKRGAGPGEFNFPTHISADPHGVLLVTDSMNGRIQLLDLQGNFKGAIGSLGDSSGHFGRPKGVAVDSFGRVYVMDGLFDNLQIFERDGRLLLSLGEAGAKPGEFWMPGGIAIGGDNRIFIADSYNHRIQVLRYIGGPS
jgi:DNA-binding beta-propeller fold protein YncE